MHGFHNLKQQRMISKRPVITRESKLVSTNINDFTYSLDVKGFVKDKQNSSPFRSNNSKVFQKKSVQKVKISAPSPLSLISSFSKNVSHKNIPTRKRRLSGLNIAKSTNHSVSMDKHMIKQKYDQVKELFEAQNYQKVVLNSKHIMLHLEYSNAQKNLFLWLVISLYQLRKYEEAVEEVIECIHLYPQCYDGYIWLGKSQLKLKNYKDGIQAFQTAIKCDPKNQIGYVQLAFCYRELNQAKKAIDFLKKSAQKFQSKSFQINFTLIQMLDEAKQSQQCSKIIEKLTSTLNRKDSVYLYLKGMLQRQKNNQDQAQILFDEAIKFNNNKKAVTKSILQTVKIQIDQRDYYKAYHTINRSKFLDVQVTEQITLYAILVEGVLNMMKKKFKDAIQFLNKALLHRKVNKLNLTNLIYKYLGYGYFKEGEHDKSIKFYKKISPEERDQVSEYNLLLAQGIELVDKSNNYQSGMSKFQKAKKVCPQKIEPYIYIAMSIIKRSNSIELNQKNQQEKIKQIISALRQLQDGYQINPNSSNLLYHRTIIHLFFEDWEQALKDINKCIEKAEQNLPKYFYLRGVCYSCIKQFKKAINEYSICISLAPDYSKAHLQKSKCSFLLGDTERGFGSLKTFMEMNPDDLTVYKWIGDLLYQGESYKDALKAYSELGQSLILDVIIMKIKCLFRVGTLNDVMALQKSIQKFKNVNKQKWNVDNTSFTLLLALTNFVKGESHKQISNCVRKLNKYLEQNVVGYVFQLIDCMNLLGVAAFYLQKYSQAYESFLLVVQLFKSLNQKEPISLKSETADQDLDLSFEDIYLNLVLCQFGQGNFKQALRLYSEQYYQSIQDSKKKKSIQKIAKILEKQSIQSIEIQQRGDKPINNKLKKVQLSINKTKIKSKPSFNLYHDSAQDLYASTVAQKMIEDLHAGYIDNMPQGPWIKRNIHGVIFTEDIIQTQNSISYEDTSRVSQNKEQSENQSYNTPPISKKEQFIRHLKIDKEVQARLNKIIKKDS